jgi:acetyl-CoA acetyltransferase
MTSPFAAAAVVGIGRTAFTRSSGRSTQAMTVEAVRNTVADAGLSIGDVDGIVNFNSGDSASSQEVAHAIGNDDIGWAVDISVRGSRQFGAPHGYMVPAQWFAMWARRHQHVYGSTAEDLGAIAVTQRTHATANPHAISQKPMTIDDYMSSRMVFDPSRVPDSCYEVDGSVALVITSTDRARDLPHKPIHIMGQGDSFGFGGNVDEFDDLTCMYSRDAAPRLWNNTGLTAKDMDIVS